MQSWGALHEKCEQSPLAVHRISYAQRQRTYARSDCRSTHVCERNTAPHRWNHEEPNSDGEIDDPNVEAEPTRRVWTGTTWRSAPKEPSWSWSTWTWSER